MYKTLSPHLEDDMDSLCFRCNEKHNIFTMMIPDVFSGRKGFFFSGNIANRFRGYDDICEPLWKVVPDTDLYHMLTSTHDFQSAGSELEVKSTEFTELRKKLNPILSKHHKYCENCIIKYVDEGKIILETCSQKCCKCECGFKGYKSIKSRLHITISDNRTCIIASDESGNFIYDLSDIFNDDILNIKASMLNVKPNFWNELDILYDKPNFLNDKPNFLNDKLGELDKNMGQTDSHQALGLDSKNNKLERDKSSRDKSSRDKDVKDMLDEIVFKELIDSKIKILLKSWPVDQIKWYKSIMNQISKKMLWICYPCLREINFPPSLRLFLCGTPGDDRDGKNKNGCNIPKCIVGLIGEYIPPPYFVYTCKICQGETYDCKNDRPSIEILSKNESFGGNGWSSIYYNCVGVISLNTIKKIFPSDHMTKLMFKLDKPRINGSNRDDKYNSISRDDKYNSSKDHKEEDKNAKLIKIDQPKGFICTMCVENLIKLNVLIAEPSIQLRIPT